MRKHIQELFTYLRTHLAAVIIVFGFSAVMATGMSVAIAKTQMPLELEYYGNGHPIDQPFRLGLGQVVAKVGGAVISPKIDGEWHYSTDSFGVTGMEFVPDRDFAPAQKYTVKLSEVARYGRESKESAEISFVTEEAPGVLSFSPGGGGSVLAADQTFRIRLKDEKHQSLSDIALESDPAVEFERKAAGQGYEWRSKTTLPQGQDFTVHVKESATGKTLLSRQFRVAAAPAVSAVSKETDLLPGDSIKLTFNEVIDKSTGDRHVTFEAPGVGKWSEDGAEYGFTLNDIEPGKDYKYSIRSGLRTKSGGILTEQIDKVFSSRGSVGVIEASPGGGELPQARQQIRISFNQPVDKASAEGAFSISSGNITNFSWSDNIMVVTVTDLGYQRSVRVGLAGGIKPAGFGLSSQAWGYGFTTEAPVVKLNVPYYKQVYAQSCEAANVRMALAYRGVGTSDWDVLQRFGYSPSSKNQETNTWDDPQKQFVGDVNGDQGKGTGWGVYAEPVAAAVRSYGRQASTHYGISAQFLAQQLHSDRPVVLWGIWGSSTQIQTWTTVDGGTASGPFPMHVRLVVGVKGSIEDPLGFYVHDPITGSAYWSTTQLMSNTQKAGPANQAVVIY